jgi:hypothetical protein
MPVTSTTSRDRPECLGGGCGWTVSALIACASAARADVGTDRQHLLRMREAGAREALAAQHACDFADTRLAGHGWISLRVTPSRADLDTTW